MKIIKKVLILTFILLAYCEVNAHGAHPKYLEGSNIYNVHTRTHEIVLTIDDGPTKGVTDRILDSLKKHQVTATFFVVGKRIRGKEYLLKRMLNEGHIVANHTYTHPRDIRKFGTAQMKNEFIKAHNIAAPYMGNGDYYYFRAPGGTWSPHVANVANSTRLGRNFKGPIMWDIGGSVRRSSNGVLSQAADWACWSRKYGYSARKCLEGYINETKTRRGGIALFHDLNMKSAELIDQYIAYFKRAGYGFVSMNDVNLSR